MEGSEKTVARRRIVIPGWNIGENVVRMGETSLGAWAFLRKGVPVAWARKLSSGKWMYFRKGSVRFAETLTGLIDMADRDLCGGGR